MNKICPKCQTENLNVSKFCKKCGSPLSGVESANSIPSQALSDIEKRVTEEKLYEQVAMELKNGIRKEGLYAKALVDANGSVELANVFYIKYAVQSLQDEQTLKSQRAPVGQPTRMTNTVLNEPPKEILSRIESTPVKVKELFTIIENPVDDTDRRVNEIQRALNDYKKRL